MAIKTPNGHAHRISRGHYRYKGYMIICVGYYPPEKKVVWECVDEFNCGFGHSFSKKECMLEIDRISD